MPESAVAVEADVQQLIIQELWPIVKDSIGLTDLEKCFTEADILACMMTLINLLPVGKAIKVVKAIPAVARAVEKIVTFAATKGKKLPVAVPAGCFASFAGSTPVLMADGTHKPIRDVRPGDYVHATDPVSGVNGPRRVIDTFVHPDSLVDLRLLSGDKITTTADHPFWSPTDRTFENAEDLLPGERVLSADGTELAVNGLDAGTVREEAAYTSQFSTCTPTTWATPNSLFTIPAASRCSRTGSRRHSGMATPRWSSSVAGCSTSLKGITRRTSIRSRRS